MAKEQKEKDKTTNKKINKNINKNKEKAETKVKEVKETKEETKTKENIKNKECFENKNNKDKDKDKENKKCILNNIKNFKCICNKERIANMFKNEKVVFKTNIVTYILFAIIAFLIQNSIVQEIQLGLRNNTCKQTCKPILTTYDNSNSSICINAILRKTS